MPGTCVESVSNRSLWFAQFCVYALAIRGSGAGLPPSREPLEPGTQVPGV